jgi:hypothetical protein
VLFAWYAHVVLFAPPASSAEIEEVYPAITLPIESTTKGDPSGFVLSSINSALPVPVCVTRSPSVELLTDMATPLPSNVKADPVASALVLLA